MTKIFVIAGHGAGDPGACSDGYSEADLVRKLANRIKALGGNNVTLGDMNINYFANKGSALKNLNISKDTQIVELHMDSFTNKSARGASVRIKPGFTADKYDIALGKFLSGMFPGRSQAVWNQQLQNANIAASKGYPYRLLECGFITNDGDRNKFINEMDKLAKGILEAFDNQPGTAAPSQPSQPQQPSNPTSTSYRVKVTVDVLNIRKGPGTNYGTNGSIKDHGVYTITAESSGQGASKWGKLKSGAGWISLDFAKRVDGSSTPAAKPSTPATIKVGSKVRVTNPVDYNGTRLGVSGTYTVMEIKGDRVVIGRNGVVTAAIRKSNLALA